MSKVWKENIKSESFWLRSLFMVLFLLVYRIVDLIVLLVAVCQWFYVLITGDANQSLVQFAASLARYAAQIVDYLGHNSDEKPFPFSDWPEAGSTAAQTETIQADPTLSAPDAKDSTAASDPDDKSKS